MNIDEIKSKFSNNQKKLLNRIEKLIGHDSSVALISLQGVEKTSQAEIEVIANIISQFSDIKIFSFKDKPREIAFIGKAFKRHKVKILPQYKVAKYNKNHQPWAIDLVLELMRPIGDEFVKIASLGVEYDGYPAHYVESKIKSTYNRDTNILAQSGIFSIRISPESWKNDPENIKKSIKKYFEHKIKEIETIQRKTLLVVDRKPRKYAECPICLGERVLANDFCPVCKGLGSVYADQLVNIDESEYIHFDCPDCKGKRATCHLCHGNGYIDREKAIEWQKSRV